ncbi:MAG TPA: flagellar basal body-associated FliL family protein [Steroidobacteraceae bacterium]|nr:flagellar basal body-associated FliL family protein [Steroidobacteraceae bacterium]
MADVPVLAPAAEDAPARKNSKWLIIGIVTAVVLIGGGTGAWFLWPHADAHAKKEVKAKEPPAPPLYVALDPPFVVNFEGDPLVRFLQVAVQVMTRDPPTVELLKANDPAVRNDLLLLLGNQKSSVLGTRDGKENLRAEALAAIRHVIEGAGGKPDKVEAIYFTSFVMQ